MSDKPTRLLLIRHGMNEYVATHRLAGRLPGVHLNDQGREQARLLGERLASLKVAAIYSSPLERARETAEAVAGLHELPVQIVDGLLEVDCGDWTDQLIDELAKTDQWRMVQLNPSGFRFPNGESMLEMQHRMITTLDSLVASHPGETIIAVSHSDPIKAAAAFYAGVPLDLFQRLSASPTSITDLVFTPYGPRVLRLNDSAHLPPESESESEKEEEPQGEGRPASAAEPQAPAEPQTEAQAAAQPENQSPAGDVQK